MKYPPMLLLLKIPCGDGSCSLWLPWFLVYFVLLAITIVALPVILLLIILLLPVGKAKVPAVMLWLVWTVVINLRGLWVEIGHEGREFGFSFV
jgi:hypothetical protein